MDVLFRPIKIMKKYLIHQVSFESKKELKNLNEFDVVNEGSDFVRTFATKEEAVNYFSSLKPFAKWDCYHKFYLYICYYLEEVDVDDEGDIIGNDFEILDVKFSLFHRFGE